MDVGADAGAVNSGSEATCHAPPPEELAETAAWLESLLTSLPGKTYLIGVGTRAADGAASSGIGATDLVDDFLRQARAAAAPWDSTGRGEHDQPDRPHETR